MLAHKDRIFYSWRIIPRMLVDTNARDLTSMLSNLKTDIFRLHHFPAELFGHTIPAPMLFAPIGINKLYSHQGESKIAGELGLPVRSLFTFCDSSSSNLPAMIVLSVHGGIPDVAAANDLGASVKNDSNSVHSYSGPNGGNAKGPRFFQLYMGYDDDIVHRLAHYYVFPYLQAQG